MFSWGMWPGKKRSTEKVENQTIDIRKLLCSYKKDKDVADNYVDKKSTLTINMFELCKY